jgi:predicted cupin superfamily sugar epimerase
MVPAEHWIETLGLVAHPEGGFFRETYRSAVTIEAGALPGHFGGPRAIATAIYYLLKGDQRSVLHRLRADEVWHFYFGSSLTLHLIHPGGRASRAHVGPGRGEQEFQTIVPAGCWFGAEVDNRQGYTLAGCTVAPGFSIDDFELGSRSRLLAEYPEHRALIERLTRQGPD